MSQFHPIIEQWFASRFAAPTEPQRLGWPAIANGEHVLIAAPTGSGKTLTAFLAVIDRLLRRSLREKLNDGIRVVYVSPLRALSNDMHRNLDTPLREISELVEQADLRTIHGEKPAPIRVGLRTGDTSSSQRATLVRKPPHILVTTPESLYLMLTSVKGRAALKKTETVIVDEIHALVRDKRGSHLALSLERLQALCKKPLQRIGLSATQRPIERMAEFLVGSGEWGDSQANHSLQKPLIRGSKHCYLMTLSTMTCLPLPTAHCPLSTAASSTSATRGTSISRLKCRNSNSVQFVPTSIGGRSTLASSNSSTHTAAR